MTALSERAAAARTLAGLLSGRDDPHQFLSSRTALAWTFIGILENVMLALMFPNVEDHGEFHGNDGRGRRTR